MPRSAAAAAIWSSASAPAAATSVRAKRVRSGRRSSRRRNAACTAGPTGNGSASGSRPASWAGVRVSRASSSANGLPVGGGVELVGERDGQSQEDRHVGRSQPGDGQRSTPVRSSAPPFGRAQREHQRDRLALQPARREQQCVRGRGIEPVGVVDDRQHRPLAPGGGQQPERRRVHREPVGRARAGRARARPRARGAGPTGSSGSAPSTGRRSVSSAANGRSASDSAPVVARTRNVRAARALAALSSADLPIPGSPTSASAPPRPSEASDIKASSLAISPVRPTKPSTGRRLTDRN